jgi:integrase
VAARVLRPLLAQAGVPRIRFHDLRHTCATIMLSENVPAKVVSEMLGHASVAITLDIYSHVLPDQQLFAGSREDVLRQVNGTWKVAKRTIVLDANVLLDKNLSIFF